MPRSKKISHTNEIDEIREDLDSLRSNVVALTKSVSHDASDRAKHKFEDLKIQGRESMKSVEKNVKAKPLKSLMIAFGVGMVMSMLTRR